MKMSIRHCKVLSLFVFLSATFSSLLLTAASPIPASVTIGVVLPLTGDQAWYGQRTKIVIEQLYSDLQSGVALPGLPADPVGCPVSLQFRDSTGDPLTSMRHLWDLKLNYPDLIGVIGDLNDNVTLPMTTLATVLKIFSMSPVTSAASLADHHEYPYFARTALNQEVFANAWMDYAKVSKWYRFALLTTDDDTRQGFTDVMQRIAAASLNANDTSTPFDIDTYVFPGSDSDVTRIVIGEALDELAASDMRIFFLHGGDISEQILRAAYVKGLMGMGRDGIMRQWIGTFCTPELADRMQDEPWILYGTYCIEDPRPKVYNDRPTNAAELNFQTRLQTVNPTYFPTDREITWREISAANTFVAFVSTMRTVFRNPAVDNSPASMIGELCGNYHQITQIDGSVINFLPSGDVKLNPEFVNWDVRRLDWISTAEIDIMSDPNNWSPVTSSYSFNNLPRTTENTPTFANSLSAYPKDRARVYVEGDDLPLSLSGQLIVLTYVVCVLAAWTALILLEQALSFWSRGVWKEAVGWVALASFAFGSCSIWPNMIMGVSSITLDVDARLYLEHPALIGTAFYPIPGVFICFMLSLTSVLGGLKPAPHVNVNEVSEVSKSSVTSSKSGTSRSHLRNLRHAVSKRWQKLMDFCKEVAAQSTWRLLVAGVVLAFVMYTEFLILQEYGFYWKVHFVPRVANVAGAIILSAALNIISLAMYFHVTRSSMRYVSPFILGITTLAQFLIIIEGSRFTYSETVDITNGAVFNFVNADGTIAAIVAVVCAAVCILLMVFNVNRLRLSRNALDKVLNQVGGQLKSIETEIDYVKLQKMALYEQADFLRRNLEVINLCRPVWRPYSVALALADAEENSFEKAEALKKAVVTGANPILPNPEKRTVLQSAMKKPSDQSALDKNKSRNDNQVSESGASKLHSKAAGNNNLAAPSVAPEMSESKDANDATSAVRDDAARKKRMSVDFSAPDVSGVGASPTPAKSEKKTTILVAPKPTAAEKEASAGGSKNKGSKSPPPPEKATLDDWSRIHASKKPKQLVALLREISDMSNLESPLPSKVIQDIRLPQILSLPSTLELMKDVLGKNLSPENIALWIDIQRFRSLENANIRKAVADEICQAFIASGAKFEVNLSSFMRDYVLAQVNKNHITLDLFDEVEKEIFRLMVTNNVDALSHSNMMKLVAILLMHPQYKLKNMTMANNARGEIDGNESPLVVMPGGNGTGLITAPITPTPLFHARKPSTSVSVAPIPVINRPIGNAPGKLSRNPSRVESRG